ncbi:non-specific lipid-transfer protein-like protein [Heracleum sosnowskyi]|uniref:Non-specific lipid-transfer protein-like protein n=1 Tax=Heracleum sosnowskyi TaxID=360622 RepID=A0AAD8MV04_9APIA|nr:non-specific lipid-transfer protein-like protein [Heracleum sosnowskyi]
MENQRFGFVLTFILLAVLWTTSTAQSDCDNMVITMSPCLNYISTKTASPMPGCCTQLSSIIKLRPDCLCQVLNGGGSSLGLSVNQTQAQALPTTCNVKTQPLSSCKADNPNSTPARNPDSTKEAPPGNGSSDGSLNNLAVPLFFLVFVVSFASITV